MTKKKVVLLVCLLVFIVLLVLNGTVFTVSSITITDFRGEQTELDKQKISEYAGIKGMHILTISESKVTENIEQMMPYVKVEDVVRVSPWGVEIVVSQRVEILAVKNENNGYAIMDRECKVLRNVETIDDIEITVFENDTLVSASVGQTVGLDSSYVSRIKQIVATFEQMGNEGYRDKNFCKAVKSIRFDGDSISIKMCEGAEFRYDTEDGVNKLHVLISYFNTHEENRKTGVYTVVYESGEYRVTVAPQ